MEGEHKQHAAHTHEHGPDCGHQAVGHGDHTDYRHDGHSHTEHAGHWDECSGKDHAARVGSP